MLIIFAVLLPTVLGFLTCVMLLRKENIASTGLLDRLCLAYPVGMGMLTFQMFFLGILRIPLNLMNISSLILIEVIGLSACIYKNNIPLFPEPSFGFFEEVFSHNSSWFKKVMLTVLMIWIVFKLSSVLYFASIRPIWAWDAWANWSASAKVFFYSNSLLLDDPPVSFFGANTVSRLQSYPLHNSLMQVWFGLWSEGFDEVMVKFWSPFYLISISACLYNFGRREFGRFASLGVILIFISSQFMSYHAIDAYSDLPLGAHLLFALLSFLNAMRGAQAYLPLVGFFSSLALFTKNESPGFIFPLVISVSSYLWLNRSHMPIKQSFLRFIVPLSLIIPWFLFKYLNSFSLTQDDHVIRPIYHSGVIEHILRDLLSLQNYNIIYVSLPFLLLLYGRPTKEFLHLFFPIAFYAFFFIMLYTFVPYYNTTLLQGTIFYRNFLTLYPSVCMFVILLLNGLLLKISDIPFSSKRTIS